MVHRPVRPQVEQHWRRRPRPRPSTPLPPDAPNNRCRPTARPASTTTVDALQWLGGPWAHLYDLYSALTSTPSSRSVPTALLNLAESPTKTPRSQQLAGYALPTHARSQGTTYYWRVVGKDDGADDQERAGLELHHGRHRPAAAADRNRGDRALCLEGASSRSAPGRSNRIRPPPAARRCAIRIAGAAKIVDRERQPRANYFELTFNAEAGRAYHLWIRGKADSNNWANDSVFVQFTDSRQPAAAARPGGSARRRRREVNLEDCSGCGLSGWGWQDNGYGINVLGPPIYFATTGPQTIRVQTREDGFSIDQIVLSHTVYLNTSARRAEERHAPSSQEADGSGIRRHRRHRQPPPATPEIRALCRRGARSGVERQRGAVEADASRRGRLEAAASECRRWRRSRRRSATPAALLRDDVQRARRARPTGSGSAARAELNNWANDSVFVQFDPARSRERPCADMADRHHVRGRDEPGGLQRLRSCPAGAGRTTARGSDSSVRVSRGTVRRRSEADYARMAWRSTRSCCPATYPTTRPDPRTPTR